VAVAAQKVYVPGYFKSDGTYVNGYWRDNTQGRGRLPSLKGARTFRDVGTFKPRKG